MTPRPADEARRALREARERGEGAQGATADAGVHAGPADREPAREHGREPIRDQTEDPDPTAGHGRTEDQVRGPDRGRKKPEERTGPRPGDVARAALRSARTARHVGADGGAGGTARESGNPRDAKEAKQDSTGDSVADVTASGPPGSPGTPRGEAGLRAAGTRLAGPTYPEGTTAAAPADHSDAAAVPSANPTSPPGEASAPGPARPPADATPAARPGSADGGDGRPADVAREALRAARRQAKSDTAVNGAASTRRLSRSAGRPQGAVGGPRIADARAVRDFVAGAFRLPPETDPTGDPLPLGDPGGAPTGGPAGGGSAKSPVAPHPHPRPAPSHDSYATPASPTSTADEPWPSPAPSHEPPPAQPPRLQEPHPAAHGHAFSAPPAKPRTPRSMAAPGRDGELRRTFPAFPPRAANEGFAGTWWGNAWVTALEEGALDAARLARGRGYAERGHVDAITVTPGLVLAYVQGSRPRPYRVQVRLRTLGDADWERFLDAAVERPGHIAALLDKELPHSLADCGVPLLPGPGDLAPQCSCPDAGHPCKHAAALCYQTARLLDTDPFVLLLLRGRGERELLDALSRLNAARAARAAQDRGPASLPGVRAGEALTARALPPLPAPLPAPPHPEQPPAYPAAPGGPDPFALDQLATDAAARAHTLLTTGRDPVGGLTLWQDAVRLAAARPGSGLTAGTRALYASLAKAAGRDTAELARAVAAWRQGGPEGLHVLEEPWDPPAGRFDRARPLLLAADLPAFRPWRNRLTHPRGHVQLRLGRTGLWYAYESEPGRDDWWPRGTPDLDPVGALTGLGTPGDV
ncbi:SWIM zinc finger family protein [Streptomyces sp. NPDC018972]|uniref:SWIM zinc finger family protein n=1 Tax=Streptomyces sp. NPDC018972 TaxID=3365060 RepID=UPI0037A556BD